MTTVAPKSASKYTPEMEAAMIAAQPLDQAKARALAAQFGEGFSDKSVAAKASRMGLVYNRKVAVSKTGAPVEKKETIVAQIEAIVGESLDGLDKAPKQALQSLRDFVAALAEDESE